MAHGNQTLWERLMNDKNFNPDRFGIVGPPTSRRMVTLGPGIVPDCGKSLHEEISERFIKLVNERQDELIKARLEYLGIKLDLEQEKLKRFKSLAIETVGEKTTIWYNDGTVHGQRVLTYWVEHIYDPEDPYSFKMNTKYY